MNKFLKYLLITIVLAIGTLGIGLIIWGIVALIKKLMDS